MKLNQDCIRDLMLVLEKHPSLERISAIELHKYNDLQPYKLSEVVYVILVLSDGGFLTTDGLDDINVSVYRMTYSGHELLEAVRKKDVWEVAKAQGKQLGAVTLPMLIKYALEQISKS